MDEIEPEVQAAFLAHHLGSTIFELAKIKPAILLEHEQLLIDALQAYMELLLRLSVIREATKAKLRINQ